MVFYNIFSISVFSVLLVLIRKFKSFIGLYFIALVEVVAHQLLAEYFLGSATSFHYFILLMGLIPYFVFGKKLKPTIFTTLFSTILFIVLEFVSIQPRYYVSYNIINAIRIFNISMTMIAIICMIFIFTRLVNTTEESLQNQNIKLESEIKMASVIQQNFFKQDTSLFKDYKVCYYSSPMAGVSGDIYDFYGLKNKLEGVGIFDVSGHGISSGLVTMLVKNIIHKEFHLSENLELWEILNNINDNVIEAKGDIENYLTGLLIRFNDTKMEISSAGHPMPIIYRANTGKCEFLTQSKQSVGVIGIPNFPVFYYSETIDFNSGDELFLYTDGITDIENSNGIKLGDEKLLEIVNKYREETVENQISKISEEIDTFRNGCPQNDDITFIIIKK